MRFVSFASSSASWNTRWKCVRVINGRKLSRCLSLREIIWCQRGTRVLNRMAYVEIPRRARSRTRRVDRLSIRCNIRLIVVSSGSSIGIRCECDAIHASRMRLNEGGGFSREKEGTSSPRRRFVKRGRTVSINWECSVREDRGGGWRRIRNEKQAFFMKIRVYVAHVSTWIRIAIALKR